MMWLSSMQVRMESKYQLIKLFVQIDYYIEYMRCVAVARHPRFWLFHIHCCSHPDSLIITAVMRVYYVHLQWCTTHTHMLHIWHQLQLFWIIWVQRRTFGSFTSIFLFHLLHVICWSDILTAAVIFLELVSRTFNPWLLYTHYRSHEHDIQMFGIQLARLVSTCSTRLIFSGLSSLPQ